jgi:L-seryl-tRNA(Ser) seleniumtransferase
VSDVTSVELRALMARVPSVEQVMASPDFLALTQEFGRSQVLAGLRGALDSWRVAAQAGQAVVASLEISQLALSVGKSLREHARAKLRSVFNLTGTVLHTNLGRALLPDEAVSAVVKALTQPSNLEFDLDTGKRGDRDDLIDAIICELTGAEAATVVNNNAAAVFLTLSALASKKEVIVSRGELVEIGGAFRIPDIMSQAGAKLREVGTTNRTHLKDYDEAVGPRTAITPLAASPRRSVLASCRFYAGRAACPWRSIWAVARWSISRNGACRVRPLCVRPCSRVPISLCSAATSCLAARKRV